MLPHDIAAEPANQRNHQRHPQPRQHEQRLAGQGLHRQPGTQSEPHRPVALERERRPAMRRAMRRVPDQNRREHRQRQHHRDIGLRAPQPPPMLRTGRQIEERPPHRQHRRVFGEHRQPGAHPRSGPPSDRPPPGLRQRAQQTKRRPNSAASNGPSGSTHVPVVTPNTGETFTRHRRPESRPPVGHQAADPPDQELRHREQQDKRQPDHHRRLGAQQMGRPPGQPPTRRRMIEIAETQHPPGCHHIALVHAQPGGRGKREPDQGGRGDHSKIGGKPHAVWLLLLPSDVPGRGGGRLDRRR